MTEHPPHFQVHPFEYLVKGYFHQDWQIEGENARAVLDFFASSDPHMVAGARDAAADMLARNLAEQELEAELEAAGLDYYPPGDGMTYREWLELVVERLTAWLEGRVADPAPPVRPPTPLELLLKEYVDAGRMAEGAKPLSGVDRFARDNRFEAVGARDAAAELLARGLPEEALAAELQASGLEYHPPGDGLAHCQWLELVVERLTATLEGEPTEPPVPLEGPAFEYFLNQYVRGDWDAEGARSALAALDAFSRENPREIVVAARDAAAGMLERLSEDDLEAELEAAGLQNHLPGEEMTHRRWLELVVERLTSSLEGERRG